MMGIQLTSCSYLSESEADDVKVRRSPTFKHPFGLTLKRLPKRVFVVRGIFTGSATEYSATQFRRSMGTTGDDWRRRYRRLRTTGRSCQLATNSREQEAGKQTGEEN